MIYAIDKNEKSYKITIKINATFFKFKRYICINFYKYKKMKLFSGLMLTAALLFGSTTFACDGKKAAACSKESKSSAMACKKGAKDGKACCKGAKTSTAKTETKPAPAKKTIN